MKMTKYTKIGFQKYSIGNKVVFKTSDIGIDKGDWMMGEPVEGETVIFIKDTVSYHRTLKDACRSSHMEERAKRMGLRK